MKELAPDVMLLRNAYNPYARAMLFFFNSLKLLNIKCTDFLLRYCLNYNQTQTFRSILNKKPKKKANKNFKTGKII